LDLIAEAAVHVGQGHLNTGVRGGGEVTDARRGDAGLGEGVDGEQLLVVLGM
jgi:hypothetical protein